MTKQALPTAAEVAALAKTSPDKAWKLVAPHFKLPVPKAKVAAVDAYIGALQRHGAKLPATWRTALVALLEDDTPFHAGALLAMSFAPHEDYVGAVVAALERSLQDKRDLFAEFGEVFGHAWDDRATMEVLAKVGDARAVPALEALLVQADKVSHWPQLLDACERTQSPALVPALQAWRTKSAAKNPAWEGVKRADQVIKALTAVAKKKKLELPAAPSLAPLVFEKKKGKKKR